MRSRSTATLAYRSLKEAITCLELCRRLYQVPAAQAVDGLIEEGDQIARMVHGLMRRLSDSGDDPEIIGI
jgi:four helix bundle protein